MEYDKAGINKNTSDFLFLDNNNLPQDEWGSLENLKILYTIDAYTQKVHKNIFEKIKKKRIDKKLGLNVNDIKYNSRTNRCEYRLANEEVITFQMLSKSFEGLPKSLVKELESSERKGKCHDRSIDLGSWIKDSIIHTGIITIGKQKILHSVCEAKVQNGEKIYFLDWTKNLMIDKDKYIELFDFKILLSIKYEDILNDCKLLDDLTLNLKSYLVFRNEFMRDVKRNEFLFDQNIDSNNKTK